MSAFVQAGFQPLDRELEKRLRFPPGLPRALWDFLKGLKTFFSNYQLSEITI
jgi:hypothetical protein